ncbi:MAG TPA: Na+/H+ antiporter subunit G [Planctomycetes bacterium]|nr:Na+/H+ antiporter subunit G [Planctomycetota bacterium]
MSDLLLQPQYLAAGLLIAVGLMFDLFGSIGLIRMPDVYTRLQAATKCVTLGTCLILVGVAVARGFDGDGIRVLLCAVFVLITSPVGAHALAKGAYASGIRPVQAVVDKYEGGKEGTS